MVRFNAAEFLGLGLRLVCYESNEAGYRTAINRAYYACHLIGRESLETKGWFDPRYDKGDHSGVWKALKQHTGGIGLRASLGDKLQALYALREHADYHIDPIDPQKHSTSCSYCGNKPNVTSLVNENTWARAKAIAEDILPRLQNIAPKLPPP